MGGAQTVAELLDRLRERHLLEGAQLAQLDEFRQRFSDPRELACLSRREAEFGERDLDAELTALGARAGGRASSRDRSVS